jgi:hypothetical protein
MTEDEIRDLLREMRDDPIPADSLARVRLGLAARLQRRTPWRIWAWAIAGVAVLLVALLYPKAALKKPAIAPLMASQMNPAVELPPLPSREPVHPTVRPVHHRTAHASQPITIRIETPDPDIVILLVGE